MQCEICGKDAGKGIKVRVEGSEMRVCRNCSSLGTKVEKKPPSGRSGKTSARKKTSGTGSSSSSGSSSASTSGSRSKSYGSSKSIYDEIDEVVIDYPERIKRAREMRGLTQEELSDKVNEKTSLIRKLERGDKLPEDTVVSKLEKFLDIELTESE